MDIGAVATAAFGLAILATMFAIGLRTSPADSLHLMQHWDKGAKAFAAVYLIVPAVTMLLCYLFPLPPAVEAALIALSVAPMLPTLPNDLAKLGTAHDYAISLEVIGAFAALIAAPIAFWIVSKVERLDLDIGTGALLLSLAKGVLLPLGLGVLVNLVAPTLSKRVAGPLTAVAGIVLLVAALILIWQHWDFIVSAYSWSVLAGIAALILAGLLAGHVLGGPDPTERAALAVTAASRHIGFAIAVGVAVAPNSVPEIAGTILIYFLLRGLLVLPYTRAFVKRPKVTGTS